MVSLLGLRYRWFKDGKRIRHPRSAWFMKFHEVKLRDTGVYTCKVLMAKQERSRSFFLKVFRKFVCSLSAAEITENILKRKDISFCAYKE